MVLKFQISDTDEEDKNASVTIKRGNVSEKTGIKVKKATDGYYYY